MPCRSPPQAQPYLSMAQQNGGGPPPTQPKKPAGLPGPAANGPAVNGNGHHQLPQRNGYNARAMEEIKSALIGFEKGDRPPGAMLARPVSALSTGSSTNSAYSSDYVQCLALGITNGLILDEVRSAFFDLSHCTIFELGSNFMICHTVPINSS